MRNQHVIMMLMDEYLRDQQLVKVFRVGHEDPKETRPPAEVADGHLVNALYYALSIRDKVRDHAQTTSDEIQWVED